MITRAIYVPDIIHGVCNIFELKKNKFICIDDAELQYDISLVLADDDWLVISIMDDMNIKTR